MGLLNFQWLRIIFAGLATVSIVSLAFGSEIEQVLRSSEQKAFSELTLAPENDPRIAVLQKTLDGVLAIVQPTFPVEMKAVTNPVAEALLERLLVVNVEIGDFSEGEIAFAFAHEISHLVLNHFKARVALYEKHIPGAVRKEHTDRIAHLLGPEAHALAHLQEFEADAMAFEIIKKMGFGIDDVARFFLRHGAMKDTATHPSTQRRIMQLRLKL